MNEFKNSKLFFWTVEILLLIIILYFFTRVEFILYPIRIIAFTILPPLTAALFLYYLCNPLVTWLGKLNIPKPLSILIILLSFITLVIVIVAGIIPGIVNQTSQLISSFPAIVESASQHINSLGLNLDKIDYQTYFEELDLNILSIVTSTVSGFFTGIGSVAGSLWSVGITVITAPIVLIYLFKDGHRFMELTQKMIPLKFRSFFENIFASIHQILQAYIVGQAIVCTYVGVSLFLCYTIVGLPYAFLLGILAGVMDIIPYAGPWIAAIPAIIVAFSISPFTALVITLAIIVIQLGESYFVSPYVMGKSLHLHPITVIFILLIAGRLAGLIGMILGIPIFMIIKIIITELIVVLKPAPKLEEE